MARPPFCLHTKQEASPHSRSPPCGQVVGGDGNLPDKQQVSRHLSPSYRFRYHKRLTINQAGAVMLLLAAWVASWLRSSRDSKLWRRTSAIVVCGGGLTEDGQPAPWVVPRIQLAHQLYLQAKTTDSASMPPLIIVTSAGTPHKPSGLPCTLLLLLCERGFCVLWPS